MCVCPCKNFLHCFRVRWCSDVRGQRTSADVLYDRGAREYFGPRGGSLWRYIAPVFGTARRRAYCSATLFARGKDILYRSVAQATMNTFQQGEGNTFPQKRTRRKKARVIFCADFPAVVFVHVRGNGEGPHSIKRHTSS